ncbi:MAG: hypothetical protein Q7U83_10520 [Daejeonella sp.]|nr:hypothetical protein [Daejeonella sp.]
MSRLKKLQRRFLSVPKYFTWEELVKIYLPLVMKKLLVEKRVDQEGNSKTLKTILSPFINLIRPTY